MMHMQLKAWGLHVYASYRTLRGLYLLYPPLLWLLDLSSGHGLLFSTFSSGGETIARCCEVELHWSRLLLLVSWRFCRLFSLNVDKCSKCRGEWSKENKPPKAKKKRLTLGDIGNSSRFQLAGEECCPKDLLEQAVPSHLAKWSSLFAVEAWQASGDFYSPAMISKDIYDTIGTIAKDFCYSSSNCYNKLLLKQCLYCSLLLLHFWVICCV